ncbi:MAG: hypothetical protein WBA67_06695 [Jannaschia sp.]
MLKIMATLFFAALAGAAAAQGCSEIRFARGAFSGQVSGQADFDAPLCFSFGTGAGQQARLQILGSNNVCFAIEGIVDCTDDFTFRTRQGTYYVNVFQALRNGGDRTFALRLTIQ